MDNVYTALQSGGVVFVPGRRLAMALREDFAERQSRSGIHVWETPRILSLDDWVSEQLKEMAYHGQLIIQGRAIRILHPIQQQTLWLQILGISDKERPSAPRLLDTVLSAWKMVHESGSSLPKQGTGSAEDQAFLTWAKDYTDLCDRMGVRDIPALWPEVLRAIAKGCLQLPRSVLWYGFLPDVEPRREALDKVLREQGVHVETFLPQSEQSGVILRYRETDEEWRAAGLWAAQQVEDSPGARVAIVVPDLNAISDRVARIILESCSPAAIQEVTVRTQGLVDLSVSHPFVQEPVIAAALSILDLVTPVVDFPVISEILRSSWISGHQDSRYLRARLDLELRRILPARCDESALYEVFRLASAAERQDRTLANMWENAGKVLFMLRGRSSEKPSRWMTMVEQLLKEFGWPEGSDLTSEPFQYYRKFQEVCSSMALADEFSAAMQWSEFLELFKSALDIPFLPRASGAPIQILSPEVAVGMTFDALWISGVTDEVLPPKVSWNPLLPPGLRDLCSPWRGEGKAWSHAESLLRALHACAPKITSSWAERRSGEERLFRPSPLLSLTTESIGDILAPWASRAWASSPDFLEDRPGDRPVPLGSASSTVHGYSTFEDQAACPFRRYARHLLNAQEMESPAMGLSDSELGQTMHAALASFWKEVKTYEALSAMTRETRLEMIHKAVNLACDALQSKLRFRMTSIVRQVEIDRMKSVLEEWIACVELPRAPFMVEAVEENIEAEIEGFSIKMRVDRVDRILQGEGLLVIDYKTGQVTSNPWFEERLESPQLPIYAQAIQETRGIAFACLKKTKSSPMRLEGSTADETWSTWMKRKEPQLINGDQAPDWNALVEFWNLSLSKLAKEIREGRVEVDPKSPSKTCMYCSLPSLCRKWELTSCKQVEEGEDE